MHSKLVNILRICFIIVLLVLGFLSVIKPAQTETNILKALFSQNENVLVDLSTRFSAKINVIVESDSPEKSQEISQKFYSKVDKDKIHTTNADIVGIITDYEKYHNNLLSAKTYNLLKNKQYEKVEQNSLEALYNPIMQPIGSIEEDPFLLLTDFVMNLSGNGSISDFTPFEYNGKYYSLVMLTVNNDLALSPTVLNDEIKTLVEVQKELSKDGTEIYLTGAPVHSYYASSRSMFEINLICILSVIFVTGLLLWYFRSLKPLIFISLSILTGIFTGYALTSLIFKSIHILTFVFSTTLIGICVDYSLHYFVSDEGKDTVKEIFKSLTVSLVTTVSAFVVLLFANFILLKQISVFTITGLTTVYLIVILFYPLISWKFSPEQAKRLNGLRQLQDKLQINWDFVRSHWFVKYGKVVVPLILLIILAFIVFRTTFDDNIKNMYVPPKFLINSEKLFGELVKSGGDISIFVVKGDNLEDILQKEEVITDKLTKENISFQSLSKYVPSEKRQRENQVLIKQLYKDKLNEYGEFLPPAQRQKLITQSFGNGFLSVGDDFAFLKNNFLIDKNTSIVIAYEYKGGEIDGIKAINFQKDISSQIRKCRLICLGLLLPIFVLLYLLLAKIYDYKAAVKIISPSICAVIFVFAILGIFKCPVNFFHILAIFLIIGFGLDYSVLRYAGAKNYEDAVFMSCMTSVFSFTLLAFAGFKLVSALGTVLAIGLLSSYIFSVILISRENKILMNSDIKSDN